MSNTLQDTTLRGTTNVVGTLNLPAGCVTAADIEAGAGIETSKTVHRHSLNYSQASGSSVASATVPIFIARGTTGLLVSIETAILVAAAGSATVTVDLQKSTGGGAFASVLSSVITLDTGNTVRVLEAGTINSTSFTDGDILELVIVATAAGGTIPQGLIVTLTLDETAS